jgi:hypothetical protein
LIRATLNCIISSFKVTIVPIVKAILSLKRFKMSTKAVIPNEARDTVPQIQNLS